MSGSNRNLIVTIGLVALVATIIALATWPIEPTLQQYGYDNPDAKGYYPGDAQCEPTALAAIRNRVVRLRAADACGEKAEEDRHNRNDLVQQTRAADAAAAQVTVANQTLWMGWFQTIGGFITLAAAIAAAIYARDASKHTDRGATATDNAVKETQRIGEAQVRCYISGVSAKVGFVPQDNQIVVVCAVRNSGQSPARCVRGTGAISFVNPHLPEPGSVVWITKVSESPSPHQLDIPAGGEEDITFYLDGSFEVLDFSGITTKRRGLFVLEATFSGEDIFGLPIGEEEYFACTPHQAFDPTDWVELKRDSHPVPVTPASA